MSYDSRPDTHEHIAQVRGLVLGVVGNLIDRAHRHDRSKLEPPEVEVFDRVTPRLKESTYGSDEYKGFLEEMGEGLQHHYAVNDHHPEHFPAGKVHETVANDETEYIHEPVTVCHAYCEACEWTARGDPGDTRDAAVLHERENSQAGGITAMSLIQLTEMLCDWIAATRRHNDGDIRKSIEQNAERFGYGEEIERLLLNTVDEILEAELSA